ncbi:response regulator transcription factor [Stenotrophobium rhamnosiphilum]|nr:LuxR C-terminal-related transcriptional regulator [Stenotrophobium rhamnosiphilum]
MQTSTQNHMSTTIQHSSFVVSAPEISPLAQALPLSTDVALFTASLTPRETEILELQGKGFSLKGAARGLGISPGTVKWHVKNIYWKLGASSREDALSKAREWQLIQS